MIFFKKKHDSILFTCVLVAALLFLSAPYSVLADALDDKVEKLRTHARIDWHQVSAPTGSILLAKHGPEICAIKFSKYDRGRNNEPHSWSYSGGETFTAEYEWRCFNINDEVSPPLEIISGHGELIHKPYRGIPFTHIRLQSPKDRIKCGNFKLFWMYPTSVSFDDGPYCRESSVELAPTKLTTFEEALTAVRGVTWYKCNEHRKGMYIPLDEL